MRARFKHTLIFTLVTCLSLAALISFPPTVQAGTVYFSYTYVQNYERICVYEDGRGNEYMKVIQVHQSCPRTSQTY